jgi:hypothetical protein
MSSTPITDAHSNETALPVVPTLLVCLPSMAPDVLDAVLFHLSDAFPTEDLLVATPDPLPQEKWPRVERIVRSDERAATSWVLGGADYSSAAGIAAEREVAAVLLLGGDSAGLSTEVLDPLVECIRTGHADLALPRFSLGVGSGLVTAALIYPMTRALFAADIRFPLPAAAACSVRMMQRLGTSYRTARGGVSPSLLWPVAEAAVAGYAVREIEAGEAAPPQPQEGEFNDLFQAVTASLFTDIEAKASFWQRFRSRTTLAADALPPSPRPVSAAVEGGPEVAGMIDAFHLAHDNLQEIWGMVLPPQTRLALKKLSVAPAATFAFEPHLWARVVYDFTLAFHLRTLNRGHLLGAMTPLYLAWVASHLLAAGNDKDHAARHIEATAACFELEKPYLVSRWRWPDRFNP